MCCSPYPMGARWAVRLIPFIALKWHTGHMSGTYAVTVGERGRLVLPAQVRERHGIGEGTELVLVEASDGLALLTRAQLKRRVREDLTGPSLVADLIAERRAAAQIEDA